MIESHDPYIVTPCPWCGEVVTAIEPQTEELVTGFGVIAGLVTVALRAWPCGHEVKYLKEPDGWITLSRPI